jgi:MOSC domain-containing protein YiiM
VRWNTRSHQNVINVGEHGPEERWHCWDLDLRQEIDTDEAIVSGFRQRHFHERSEDEEVVGALHVSVGEHWNGAIRRTWSTLRFGVFGENVINDGLERESIQRNLQALVNSMILQPSNEYRFDARTRYDTELSAHRNTSRQGPMGDRDTHSALDEPR